MPEIPPCANHREHTCERSDTYVKRETDQVFVIECRTCRGISVWPKDRAERRGRYEGFLHQQAVEQSRQAESSRARLYSIPGTRPGEKT